MFNIQRTPGSCWRTLGALPAAAVLLMAGDLSWQDKPIPSWTAEDTQQILADSPWAKTVQATIAPLQNEDHRREGGNMGQDQGIGFDGVGAARPRMVVPQNLRSVFKAGLTDSRPKTSTIALQLRWESALPIRAAELQSVAPEPPKLAGDGYRIAVYGVPSAKIKGDPKSLGVPLKQQAVLKREGKKDVRPSSVEVFQRDNGIVVVYTFPPLAEFSEAEFSEKDARIEFNAQIGRIVFAQSFDLGEMRFQGKLEL